ncbi:hypothetical protein CAAN1_28S00804 [[Candida] anglica]|uniref:F-box domain-containing protein n=1 Tax=[Candida] anglica TaxID=148631 RepID=A0ABP0EMJ8_9ASCO
MLLDLPFHIIDSIISKLDSNSLVSLSSTNSYFRLKINSKLYEKILIIDPDTSSELKDSTFTLLPLQKLPTLVSSLRNHPENIHLINQIIINSQTNGSENPYLPLYQIISTWKKSDSIVLENMDINNLRAFRSITQLELNPTIGEYTYENDEEMVENVNTIDIPFHSTKVINWTIFDFDELTQLPHDSNINELNVMMDSLPSMEIKLPEISECLPNLSSLYLNSPAATLSILNNSRQSNPLRLTKLSLTNSHSIKNFGFKSGINTKLSFKKLNKVVDLSNLRELELKINCDFHNNCEDECMVTFFSDWSRELKQCKLEKLAILNFKSNSTSCNQNQFYKLINNLPHNVIKNLEELYINVDDFTNLPRSSNNNECLDFSKLKETLINSNIKRVVLPDFFQSWFIHIPNLRNASPNIARSDYFNLLVNNCDCHECIRSRKVFTKYADYDSSHGYKHKFTKLNLDEDDLSNNSMETFPIDISQKSNFKFLNYLVCLLKKRLSYSHKNIFTVNSTLKMDEKPMVISKDANINSLGQLLIHSSLFDCCKELVSNSSVNSINFGGISFEVSTANDIEYLRAPYDSFERKLIT